MLLGEGVGRAAGLGHPMSAAVDVATPLPPHFRSAGLSLTTRPPGSPLEHTHPRTHAMPLSSSDGTLHPPSIRCVPTLMHWHSVLGFLQTDSLSRQAAGGALTKLDLNRAKMYVRPPSADPLPPITSPSLPPFAPPPPPPLPSLPMLRWPLSAPLLTQPPRACCRA